MTARELNRWRIMALLVEALQVREFIHLDEVRPRYASAAEVVDVLTEAGMVKLSDWAWTPGKNTTAWVVLHTEGLAGLTPREAHGFQGTEKSVGSPTPPTRRPHVAR